MTIFRSNNLLLLLSLTVSLQQSFFVRGGGGGGGDVIDIAGNIINREEELDTSTSTTSTTALDSDKSESSDSNSDDHANTIIKDEQGGDDDFRLREQISLLTKGPSSSGGGFANRPAISVGFHTASSSTKTHSQLHKDARRLAATMRRHITTTNQQQQHRIFLAVSSGTDYNGYIFLLACIKNAYSYVNTGEKVAHPMFNDIVDKIQPSMIVVDKVTYDEHKKVRDLVSTQPFGSVVVSMDHGIPGVPCLFDNDEHTHHEDDDHQNDDNVILYDGETFPLDNEATVTFTSGSSGRPKICAFSYRAMLRVAYKAQQIFNYDIKSVLLGMWQYAEGTAYELQYLPSLVYGSHLIPVVRDNLELGGTDELTAVELYSAVFAQGVTTILTSPVMLGFISDTVEDMNVIKPELTNSVSTIATLGAKLSTTVRDRAARVFSVPGESTTEEEQAQGQMHNNHRPDTPLRVLEIYGSTECHMIGSKDAFDDDSGFLLVDGVESHVAPRLNNSKMDNNSSNVVSASQGVEDVEGDIFIRSDHAMTGYVDANGVNPPFNEEGWLGLGDIGFLSKGGRKLTLTGRTRTTVNHDGEEIDTRLILQKWEDTLNPVLQIAEAYAFPSDHGEEDDDKTAALFLLPESKNLDFESDLFEVTLDAYNDAYKSSDMYKWMHISATGVLCFVDSFPRVGRDKVDLGEVQRAYTKLVTERKFAWAESFKPDDLLTIMQLQWVQDKKEWKVLGWDDEEDFELGSTSLSLDDEIQMDWLSSVKVGSRVAVYWPTDDQFYEGEVTRIHESGSKRKSYVFYDDGDEKWHNFEQEQWRLLQA